MSIVYLLDTAYEIYGGVRVVYEQADHLAAMGLQVEIWTRGQGDKFPFKNKRVSVKKYDASNLAHPDILIACDVAYLPDVIKERPNKKNFFLLQHDIDWLTQLADHSVSSMPSKLLSRGVSQCGLKVLVVSNWLKDIVKNNYGLESYTVPNGVDINLFKPSSKIINWDKPLVASICSLEPWKGTENVLSAFRILSSQMPDVHFIMFGKYLPSIPFYSDQIANFPVPVIYFNEPDQDIISSIYSSADVFVSASTLEGFGLPVLEAMACGTAVVTTNNRGNEEIIKDGDNCLVCTGEPSEIADKISEIFSKPKLKTSLVKNGLVTASHQSWNKSIDVLLQIMKIS